MIWGLILSSLDMAMTMHDKQYNKMIRRDNGVEKEIDMGLEEKDVGQHNAIGQIRDTSRCERFC